MHTSLQLDSGTTFQLTTNRDGSYTLHIDTDRTSSASVQIQIKDTDMLTALMDSLQK